MAGTRLQTQLWFAFGIFLMLLISFSDIPHLASFYRCLNIENQFRYSTGKISQPLLEYALHSIGDTLDMPQIARIPFDNKISIYKPVIRKLPLVSSDSAESCSSSDLSVSVELQPDTLVATCGLGVSSLVACQDILRTIEIEKTNELRGNKYLKYHKNININIVFASESHHVTASTKDLFGHIFNIVIQSVSSLSSMFDAEVTATQLLSVSNWTQQRSNSMGRLLNIDNVLDINIPQEIISRSHKTKSYLRSSEFYVVIFIPDDGDVSIIHGGVQLPPRGDMFPKTNNFVSRDLGVGLILLDKDFDASSVGTQLGIPAVIAGHIRAMLGLPPIQKLSGNISAIRNIGYECSGAGEPSQTIFWHYSFNDRKSNMLSEVVFTVWELRWIHLAYVMNMADSVDEIYLSALQQCRSVEHWSDAVHDKHYVFQILRKIANTRQWSQWQFNDLSFHLSQEFGYYSQYLQYSGDFSLPSYFPIEYRAAIYSPFWIPIILPLLHGVFMEIKRFRQLSKRLQI